MRVFISWSGVTSREVAEALAEWIPKVVQGIEPFVSAKDIDKGSNWTVELARELETTEFGIVCLAPDNLLSPWLNYEAGAITRSVSSRVCPVLFKVEKEDVKPPLAQLQLTTIEREEFVLLIGSINKAAGSLLDTNAVREAVEVWWPLLEAKLAKISVPEPLPRAAAGPAAEPTQPQPDVTEMLEELLSRVRSLDSRVGRLEPPSEVVSKAPRSVSRSGSTYHRGAIEYLQSALQRVGVSDFTIQSDLDRVVVNISDVAEIPVDLSEAAALIAGAENIDLIIRSGQTARRWSGRSGEQPMDAN